MKYGLIKSAIRERKYNYWDGNWSFSRPQQLFYLAKFILCVIFGLHKPYSHSLDVVPMVMDNYHNTFNGEYSGADWEEYAVAYGFRDWFYTDYWNGYP